MSGVAEVAVAGAVAFAATNLDDLLLLAAWFAGSRAPQREVVLGQYLGIGVLTAASALCALAAVALPGPWLGLLGLLPLAIGVRTLVRGRRGPAEAPPPLRPGAAAFSVAAVTVANGGDNIAVYAPLFATVGRAAWLILAVVFTVMTAVWCLAGLALVRHPGLGPQLRRFVWPLLPWVLIGLGVAIMLRSGLLQTLLS